MGDHEALANHKIDLLLSEKSKLQSRIMSDLENTNQTTEWKVFFGELDSIVSALEHFCFAQVFNEKHYR